MCVCVICHNGICIMRASAMHCLSHYASLLSTSTIYSLPAILGRKRTAKFPLQCFFLRAKCCRYQCNGSLSARWRFKVQNPMVQKLTCLSTCQGQRLIFLRSQAHHRSDDTTKSLEVNGKTVSVLGPVCLSHNVMTVRKRLS